MAQGKLTCVQACEIAIEAEQATPMHSVRWVRPWLDGSWTVVLGPAGVNGQEIEITTRTQWADYKRAHNLIIHRKAKDRAS